MADEPKNSEDVTRPNAGATRGRSMVGTLVLLLIGAAIAVLITRSTPHSEQPRRLWTPVVFGTNGSQTILGETRQMEFWTPSAKTKDYLPKEGDRVREKDMWQVIPNDDAVTQFGNLLHTNQNVLGYRRVEVWGHGRTSFKPGWWWTMNVTTNYSVSDLGHAYQNFWKMSQIVLIEVIDNRGREE